MEKVKLICVGRLKEKALETLCSEYIKRIGGFLPFNLVELKEAKGRKDLAEDPEILEQFNRNIMPRDYLVSMDISGKKISSEQFSAWLSDHFSHSGEPLTFVIGGACGLPSDLLRRSRFRLSFSHMTFPHELFRVMFLEQLYRALSILHNHPYHR